MSEEYSILAYRENEFSWIRCDGRGSFINSPVVKDWCEREIAAGVTSIVVDLEQCKGIRAKLVACKADEEKIGQGVHVLDAHRKLCEADKRNTEKFGTVLDYLEAEVKAKEADNE